MKAKENNNNNANNVNNALNAKTLANIKKQATAFIGGFRAACVAILEVANNGDTDARKLCAFLGINTESVKNKNIGETRKNILNKLPYYYTVEGSESRFPARLKKVSAEMIEAGVAKGFIAVKDTYLNALISLGGLLSKGNSYEQRGVVLTETEAGTANEMTPENTTCVIYDKNGCTVATAEKAYITYKQAKKNASEKAKATAAIAYAEALK